MKNSRDKIKGFVSEIFSSIQGEGICVGEKHVFIRTAGCSLECSYCDTAFSKSQPRFCVIHLPEKKKIENPIPLSVALEAINELQNEYGPVKTVSITGGEPLEQTEFVAGLARELKAMGLVTYLDTDGVEHERIGPIAALFDVIAVDFKMPSAVKKEYWEKHKSFISKLAGRKVFVKIVVSKDTPENEIVKAARIIADVDDEIPLVIQPEAGGIGPGERIRADLSKKLFSFQSLALEFLETVRIIPQCHRVLYMR